MDAEFCVEALQDVIEQNGCPSIFNANQGSQFTGYLWIDELRENDIRISMDGKGRWMDNGFIERPHSSLTDRCADRNRPLSNDLCSDTRMGFHLRRHL